MLSYISEGLNIILQELISVLLLKNILTFFSLEKLSANLIIN